MAIEQVVNGSVYKTGQSTKAHLVTDLYKELNVFTLLNELIISDL